MHLVIQIVNMQPLQLSTEMLSALGLSIFSLKYALQHSSTWRQRPASSHFKVCKSDNASPSEPDYLKRQTNHVHKFWGARSLVIKFEANAFRTSICVYTEIVAFVTCIPYAECGNETWPISKKNFLKKTSKIRKVNC